MLRISILVPIYNAGAHLRRCLDSIESQAYGDFEAILVDDGSTDSSRDICMEYVNRDKRFSYHYQENAWLPAARNAGLFLAKGEYIAYIDHDDYVDEDYLTILLQRANETEADIVCSGHRMNIGDEIIPRYPENKVVELSSDKALLKHFCVDWLPPGKVYAWAKLIRREFLNYADVKFNTSLRFSEDANFFYKLLFQSKRTAYLDKTPYFYRQHEKAMTKSVALRHNLFSHYLSSHRDVCDYWKEKSFHAFDIVKPVVLIGRLKAAFANTFQTVGDYDIAARAAATAFEEFSINEELELNKLKEAATVYSNICGLSWAEQAEIWLFALSLFGGEKDMVAWQKISPRYKEIIH